MDVQKTVSILAVLFLAVIFLDGGVVGCGGMYVRTLHAPHAHAHSLLLLFPEPLTSWKLSLWV